MDRVMHFASIVGLAVVGGMVASMVSITTPLQFNTGGTELVFQDMIDQIFPQLLPLVFTLGIYWLIQKKIQYKCIVAWHHCFRTCHERNWNFIIKEQTFIFTRSVRALTKPHTFSLRSEEYEVFICYYFPVS